MYMYKAVFSLLPYSVYCSLIHSRYIATDTYHIQTAFVHRGKADGIVTRIIQYQRHHHQHEGVLLSTDLRDSEGTDVILCAHHNRLERHYVGGAVLFALTHFQGPVTLRFCLKHAHRERKEGTSHVPPYHVVTKPFRSHNTWSTSQLWSVCTPTPSSRSPQQYLAEALVQLCTSSYHSPEMRKQRTCCFFFRFKYN